MNYGAMPGAPLSAPRGGPPSQWEQGPDPGSYGAAPSQQGGFFPGDRGKADPNAPPELSWRVLIEVGIGAWVAFTVVCLLFGLSYHTSKVAVWSMIFLGSGVLTIVIGQHMRQYRESRIARDTVLIAGWFLAALVLGTAVGYVCYDCCIGEYWLSQSLEARENVLPSEPAGAYSNAGQLVFADEARVDASKSVGFKDGETYCVAPIASDAPLDTVQFWAAGVDCCGARGSFACDDSWNPKAHAGVVINNVTWTMMRSDIRGHYLKAIKLAEVTYAIASVKEPILVRWVANPDQVQLNVWRAGFGALLAAIIIAALVCGLQVCAVHFVRNKSPGGREMRG